MKKNSVALVGGLLFVAIALFVISSVSFSIIDADHPRLRDMEFNDYVIGMYFDTVGHNILDNSPTNFLMQKLAPGGITRVNTLTASQGTLITSVVGNGGGDTCNTANSDQRWIVENVDLSEPNGEITINGILRVARSTDDGGIISIAEIGLTDTDGGQNVVFFERSVQYFECEHGTCSKEVAPFVINRITGNQLQVTEVGQSSRSVFVNFAPPWRLYWKLRGMATCGDAASAGFELTDILVDGEHYDPDNVIPSCESDVECQDGNLCTTDFCFSGECINTATECVVGQTCNPDTGMCELPNTDSELLIIPLIFGGVIIILSIIVGLVLFRRFRKR